MLLLNQKEVEKIIPLSKISKIIEAVRDAFFEYGVNNIQMPAKNYLYFADCNGDLRIMPSCSQKLKIAGTKIVNVHPDNPKKGLKTVMATIILNDTKTGLPLVFMDGTYITGMRTGSASAVATSYLARKNAKTLGVIGAGYQSIFQIAAITKVRKIEKIMVYDVLDEKIKKLAGVLSKEKIKIVKADLEEVAKSDILVTVTPAKNPILKRNWILPGTHINAIGADAQGKEELDPQILVDGKIVIDNWEQASHSGEINVPLSKGIIKKNDIYADLSEIVTGKKKGRINDKEITIFDSTGLAIQDLFAANYVFKNAGKLGKKFDLM
ncbi:MAG: ornithine cyclodeaminase family protein [Parcubacteria group bacterium]